MTILSSFTTEYRAPIVALLCLALLAFGRTRWRFSLGVDALLIALYAARPSLGTLVLIPAAMLIRWHGALAGETAALFGYPWNGLTAAFGRLLLPGMEEAPRAEKASAATGKTTKLIAPMPLRGMLSYVNGRPQDVPHLAIIGPSGSGKTTLATVVLSDRPGLVVVLTAKEGDTWGGLPYVGIDDDATYTTAQATFQGLDSEVKQRLITSKHGGDPGEWLTIVVDDFSTLQSECPIAPAVVKLVARMGRSLRVRLIMLSDSALVKAIGLEGEGETRGNFAFVRLERGHSATLEVAGDTLPVDTRGVDRITVNLAGRDWACSVPTLGASVSVPGTGNGNGTGNGASIEVLRALRSAGWTREQARNSGLQFRDEQWTKAGN